MSRATVAAEAIGSMTPRLLLSTLLFGALAARAAAAAPIVLDYDVRFGPLRLMSMRTTADIGPERYSAIAEMRTVGLVATLFPWESRSLSSGVRRERTLTPFEHRTEGLYRGQRRLVDLDYRGEVASVARIEPPPEEDWREAVPTDLRRDTIDPLTATLAALESDCRGTLRVFDGRRRYDLHLSDLGTATLEDSSYRFYAGPTRRCQAVVQALGGFWRDDPRHSEKPTTLDYWIAAPQPDLPQVPVYLELAGARGTLAVHLTGVVR